MLPDGFPNARRLCEMVDELLDVEDNLSDWELAFIESMRGKTEFTEKQAQKIKEIYDSDSW